MTKTDKTETMHFFIEAFRQVVLPEINALKVEIDQLQTSLTETLKMMKDWRRKIERRRKKRQELKL